MRGYEKWRSVAKVDAVNEGFYENHMEVRGVATLYVVLGLGFNRVSFFELLISRDPTLTFFGLFSKGTSSKSMFFLYMRLF